MVRNSSLADLELIGVERTCGCVSIELDSDVIPGHGSARGELLFSVPARDGQFEKTATIRFQGGVSVALVIRGAARAPFRVLPAAVTMRIPARTVVTPAKAKLKFEGTGLSGLKLASAPEWCSVKLEPDSEAGIHGVITVRDGLSRRGQLKFENSDGFVVNVPVRVEAPRLSVTPSLFHFGDVVLGEHSQAKVVLSGVDAKSQVSVHSADDALILTTDHSVDGGSVVISCRFSPATKGVYKSVVEISVGGQRLKVPVIARVCRADAI